MDHLQRFRKEAGEGNYELSLTHFAKCEKEITEMEKAQRNSIIEGYSWKQIKIELRKEAHIVKQIIQELKFFENANFFGDCASDEEKEHTRVKNKSKHSKIKRHRKNHTLNNNQNSNISKKNSNKKHNYIYSNNNGSSDGKNKKRTLHKQNNSEKKVPANAINSDKSSNIYQPPSHMDMNLVQTIENSIIPNIGVKWSDIASLESVKNILKEMILLPILFPNCSRQPFRGLLLFGPPGTGKTMIAKAVASCSKCTFFNISPSLIISKWRGESCKLMNILFEMAHFYAPSVIFFDEIDALASSRGSKNEHESSNQLKSELLAQMAGLCSSDVQQNTKLDDVQIDSSDNSDTKKMKSGHVLVMAATNHPWKLDEALRRRFEKRVYIGLPDTVARKEMFHLGTKNFAVDSNVDFDKLAKLTVGYSGADINVLCRDASMVSIRKILSRIHFSTALKHMPSADENIDVESPITEDDFLSAISRIKSSVDGNSIAKYEEWAEEFGST